MLLFDANERSQPFYGPCSCCMWLVHVCIRGMGVLVCLSVCVCSSFKWFTLWLLLPVHLCVCVCVCVLRPTTVPVYIAMQSVQRNRQKIGGLPWLPRLCSLDYENWAGSPMH